MKNDPIHTYSQTVERFSSVMKEYLAAIEEMKAYISKQNLKKTSDRETLQQQSKG